jgi:hypothetical protein
MPFTFSHPAAVLPVHSRFKNWIPLSALVIGSLVPDAEYYLPMPEHFRNHSHTLLGTFSTSLPLGILVWLVFYWLAPSAVYLLPSPHREAIAPELKPRLASIPQALGVALAILIGAWSHVLWDSFTHSRGWIVRHVPLLQRRLFGSGIPAYKGLQYLSSALGLCVLLYAYNKWLKASGYQLWIWRKPGWRVYLWFAIVAICLIAAAIEGHAIAALKYIYSYHSGNPAILFVTSFVRDFLLAFCVVAIAAKLSKTLGLAPLASSSPSRSPSRLTSASADRHRPGPAQQ